MKAVRYGVTSVLIACLVASSAYSQTFWHGGDIADTGIDPDAMEAIHEAIDNVDWLNLSPTAIGFPTGDDVNDAHRGLRIYESGQTWDGYTLLNCFMPTGQDPNGNNVLIDMEGNIVNAWMIPGAGFYSAAKPLPGGQIVGNWVYSNDMMASGGKLTQLNWDGEIVKQWETVGHHDHERQGSTCGYFAPGAEPMLEGGKVLVLEDHAPDPNLTTHVSIKPLKDDLIRELDWEGNELFRWHVWEHFDELGLDAAARVGLDQGRCYMGPAFMADALPEDWTHGNSVAWCGPNKWYDAGDLRFHPDNIITDFRSLNITIIIARHDHPDGDWVAGDVVWKLGPDYSTASGDFMVGQIIGQHQAHMISKGLPGAGNLLIFDNGGQGGYGAYIQGLRDVNGDPLGTYPNTFRQFSRVIEIDPVAKQVVWEFKQPRLSKDLDGDGKILGNEKLFYSNLMSGMQRLPNGNTLICEADPGRVFEVTESGEVVWEYAPHWLRPGGPFVGSLYRAYRIPASWIAQILENGVPVTGLSARPGVKRYYKIDVPAGPSLLEFKLRGNATLYAKYGALPTATDYDRLLSGNQIIGLPPKVGTWYLMLAGGSYSNVTVEVAYGPSGPIGGAGG